MLTLQQNLEVNKAIDQGSPIVEKSGYQVSDNEPKPSDYYQSVSERMQLPSAVDSPQAREKTGEEDRQRLQQSHQVPLGPQPRHSISNQPTQQGKSLLYTTITSLKINEGLTTATKKKSLGSPRCNHRVLLPAHHPGSREEARLLIGLFKLSPKWRRGHNRRDG